MTRRFLVGLGVTTSTDGDPVADAIEAERLGFDFVSASDHPVGRHPTYELTTLLTWIAARTERIGVVTRVLGVPFRRPAVLAKSAESLHRLSGGRLVLGLGSGHSDDEIAALGGGRPSAGDKVTGLADAIEIMRTVWSDPVAAYDGRVHSVAGLTVEPKPIAPIPVWTGTYGPRALAVTGRLADGWIPSYSFAAPARLPELRDRISTAAVAAGRPADAVRCVYNVAVGLEDAGRTDDETVVGRAGDVVEQLVAFTALGVDAVNLVPADGTSARQLAEDVLPALRAATR